MLAQQLVDRRCPGEVVYLDLSTASREICEARASIRGLRNITFHTDAEIAFHGPAICSMNDVQNVGSILRG